MGPLSSLSRLDEEAVEAEASGGDKSRNIGQKKYVTGTSNQIGRKMRSPPADIFVYGVHPDTTPEDIVQDLACSDIIIKTLDIVVKSREEAFLKSYKISVKAEDLQKALDPSVWPLRVKVREFIHYSKKNSAGSRQRFGDQGQGQRGGNVGVVAGGAGHQYQAQQHGEQRGPPQLLLAPNRYSLPEDRVPGGPPLQV